MREKELLKYKIFNQTNFFNQLLEVGDSFIRGQVRAIFVYAPSGFGKTIIIKAVIQEFKDRDIKVYYVNPQQQIDDKECNYSTELFIRAIDNDFSYKTSNFEGSIRLLINKFNENERNIFVLDQAEEVNNDEIPVLIYRLLLELENYNIRSNFIILSNDYRNIDSRDDKNIYHDILKWQNTDRNECIEFFSLESIFLQVDEILKTKKSSDLKLREYTSSIFYAFGGIPEITSEILYDSDKLQLVNNFWNDDKNNSYHAHLIRKINLLKNDPKYISILNDLRLISPIRGVHSRHNQKERNIDLAKFLLNVPYEDNRLKELKQAGVFNTKQSLECEYAARLLLLDLRNYEPDLFVGINRKIIEYEFSMLNLEEGQTNLPLTKIFNNIIYHSLIEMVYDQYCDKPKYHNSLEKLNSFQDILSQLIERDKDEFFEAIKMDQNEFYVLIEFCFGISFDKFMMDLDL